MNLRENSNEDVVNAHIVAVAASAGGLEALAAFVSGLDSNLNCAYVIAHHTPPDYRSEMVTILSRETDLLVCDVVSGEAPQPNCIYLTPSGFHVVFKDGRFELSKALPHDFPQPSIDKLFLSLAESSGERGDTVIFSGTGSDGTISSSAVVTTGELTIAQPREIDELSASTMEMQTLSQETQFTNEELRASNEELRAFNKELKATNQELQVINEALFSVNEESLKKSDALTAINVDFEGVYNTLEFPILIFDERLHIKRVNIAAMRMFHLHNVTGHQLNELPFPKYFSALENNLRKAFASATKLEFTINYEEKSFQIYATPTLDAAGAVQGIVLLIVDNTNLISITKKQRETQDNLLSIMNNSVSVTSLKDITGRYEFVNNRFLEFTGLSNQEILGKTDFQLFDQKLAQQLRAGDLQVMSKLESVSAVEEMDFNGKTIWLSTVHFPIWGHDGAIKSICLQATDISHVKIAEEQLRLAAKVFDRSGEAIMITDARNRIATVNEEFIKIYGYEFHELIGNDPRMLRADQHDKAFYAEMWRSLLDQGWWQGELWNRKKSGEHCQSWVTINAVYGLDGEIQNFVALFSDPNSIKIAQRKIEFMASHDELTLLPNRSLLMEKIKHGIAQAVRNKKKLAVLFIDLDNFKTINDTLGHDVGDVLLKQVAERLNSCVRGSDTLARLGGDEFVALLSDIDMDTVNHIAMRTVDLLASSFRIRDRDLFVSASIGISIFPDNGCESTALLKNADTAMYRAKENGRNQYKFFTEEMKATAMQRLTIETAIRQAISQDYFRIVYQPQLDMHTGEIVGAEALLRWDDPVLGEVPPSKFIPIVEAAGLIRQVSEIVLQKVLRNINTWRRRHLKHPVISINISATQLKHADFSRKLLDSIHLYQVPTNALTLEITESVLTDNFEYVNEILLRIKDSGITISIDDFGTGYSSMMYLKRLPIHELKIDRSFIDGIDSDNDDLAIATAIIGMAHALGLKLVAEGVESKAQANLLRNLGCHTAQGFLFHHPLEVEEFEKLFLKEPMLDV